MSNNHRKKNIYILWFCRKTIQAVQMFSFSFNTFPLMAQNLDTGCKSQQYGFQKAAAKLSPHLLPIEVNNHGQDHRLWIFYINLFRIKYHHEKKILSQKRNVQIPHCNHNKRTHFRHGIQLEWCELSLSKYVW